MEVYLVRHGETVWNAEGRMQGSMDIELNEKGIEAAKKLGEELKDVKFDRIYASVLKRAYETAELIKGDRDIEVIKDERIIEMSFGDMEGSHFEEWLGEDNPLNAFFHAPHKFIPPKNGETFEQVEARTVGFIKDEIEPLEKECERVLIVAHGASNKGMMTRMEGNDIEHFWGRGLQGNCQATVFDYTDGVWTEKPSSSSGDIGDPNYSR